jgi:hypothetical protein
VTVGSSFSVERQVNCRDGACSSNRSDWQEKSPRIMKGRPFEGKFSWVVVATEFTSGRSTP